jgi:hypothetical protein
MAKMLWRMAATPSLRGQFVEHVAGASVPVLQADFWADSVHIWAKGLELKLLST